VAAGNQPDQEERGPSHVVGKKLGSQRFPVNSEPQLLALVELVSQGWFGSSDRANNLIGPLLVSEPNQSPVRSNKHASRFP
jgi:hypothetical protein